MQPQPDDSGGIVMDSLPSSPIAVSRCRLASPVNDHTVSDDIVGKEPAFTAFRHLSPEAPPQRRRRSSLKRFDVGRLEPPCVATAT